MSIIGAYKQRLKEKDNDALLLELSEARKAGATPAIEMLEDELHNRGIRTDQPKDTR